MECTRVALALFPVLGAAHLGPDKRGTGQAPNLDRRSGRLARSASIVGA